MKTSLHGKRVSKIIVVLLAVMVIFAMGATAFSAEEIPESNSISVAESGSIVSVESEVLEEPEVESESELIEDASSSIELAPAAAMLYGLDLTATAGTAQEFADAFADPDVSVIELTANIELAASQVLPGGKTLVVTSTAGNQYTLTMTAASRHFILENGSSLTLKKVTLDGKNVLGGVQVKSTNDTPSTLVLESTTIINCWAPSNVYGGGIDAMTNAVNASVTIGGASLISDNKAYWGGGIAAANSYITIEGDTIIQKNSLSGLGAGGGLVVWGAILTLKDNVQFLNNDVGGNQPGGAIYLQGSKDASISGNVKFEGNRAWVGGAIAAASNSYGYTGVLTITGSVSFIKNYANGDGGALYMQLGGTANIGTDNASNIVFSENACLSNGGAIYRFYGALNIGAGTQFTGNTLDMPYRTGASGGAVYARTTSLTITGTSARRVLFKDGRAASCGGALCLIEGTTANISYTDFINNHARNFGGAIDIDNSAATNNVTLDNCLFDGNWCISTGGAIAVEVNRGNLTVKNSVLKNNSAGGQPHDSGYRSANGTGGAIYFERGTLVIENSSITNNSSIKHGGGISKADWLDLTEFLSSITVSGTTFTGNTANVLYNMTNPTYTAIHTTNINPGEGTKIYSQGLDFAYNNFDISYQNDGTLPLPTLTVTFDATGGEPTPAPITDIGYGDGIDRPVTDPTRENAVFEGWVTENGYFWGFNTTAGANNGAPVRSDMTLYAKWTITQYSVTFMNGTERVDLKMVDGGTPVTPTTNTVTPPAYKAFDKWLDTAGNVWNFDTPVTRNIVLYASFTDKQYTVSYNTDGGTPVPPNKVTTWNGAGLVPAQNPSRAGYTFVQWDVTSGGNGSGLTIGVSSGSTYGDLAAGESTTTLVLTARWQANTGGGSSTPPASSTSSSASSLSTTSSTSSTASSNSSASSEASSSSSARPVSSSAGGGSSQPDSSSGNGLDILPDGNIPAAGFRTSWSLISLIFSVLAIIIAAFFGIRTLAMRRKTEEETDEEQEEKKEHKGTAFVLFTVLGILLGIATPVVWLIVDKLTLPMMLVNRWTPFIFVLLVLSIVSQVAASLTKRKKQEDDELKEDLS